MALLATFVPLAQIGRKRMGGPCMSISHHKSITNVDNLDCINVRRMEKVKEVRIMLQEANDPLESMIMIDSLQRLGINYHFQEEIEALLDSHYESLDATDGFRDNSLYRVALGFRLLRQHGHHVSPDVMFKNFTNEERFGQQIGEDIRGMMALYEASLLGIDGEVILDEANEFAGKHLKASMAVAEPYLADLVGHTLEHPLHMSLPRLNARHYIKNYQVVDRRSRVLQELAKLDFNIVQSLHQRELREVSVWWRDLALSQELRFARDQPLKWFTWPMAMLSHPHFSEYRIEVTKPISLIYIIDDIFDVKGSLDELILFTEAINKWDLDAIERLPEYMKICFMALHNITNDIAWKVFKEHGWMPTKSLRKAWGKLCEAFLKEAKWLQSGYLPQTDEYLNNGVVSSGVHVVLVHIFFMLGQGITRENIDSLDNIPRLFSCPATILRLWDDLGSAKDENQQGYDGSYVECYMKEQGNSASVEGAHKHVRHLISKQWKRLNEECLFSHNFFPSLKEASLNMARIVEVMYGYKDDQSLPALDELINSLLIETIPL